MTAARSVRAIPAMPRIGRQSAFMKGAKRRHRAPYILVPVRTFCPDGAVCGIELPLRLETESNVREHWARKAERTKRTRLMVFGFMRRMLAEWSGSPIVVELTRLAPRALDGHDNLRASCKAAVDGVSDALGLKTDSDDRLRWEYGQEPAGVRTYGLRIVVRMA